MSRTLASQSPAARAGLAGVILPDVPPEEAGDLAVISDRSRVPIIYLCSPTCTDTRIRKIAALSRSFIYLVSLKGVTGASMRANVGPFVRRVRKFARQPLCVGFGISTPADARRVAAHADGIIVGSALLKILQRGGKPRDVERFVRSLRKAIDR